MGSFYVAKLTRSTSPHVIFSRAFFFVTLLAISTFQLSCSGCSEDESGKGPITDTENVLSDTATQSNADSVDDADSDTREIADSDDTTSAVADTAAEKGTAVGVVSGGAQIQTKRFQMRVTVGSGAVATGQSANYRMNVGVGAQTTR